MHGARMLKKDRTSALQGTERVYYKKTNEVDSKILLIYLAA